MTTKNARNERRRRFAATLAHDRLSTPLVDYMAENTADHTLKTALGCRNEAELLDTLGVDFFYLPSRDISQNEGFVPYYRGPKLAESPTERVCPFGIRFARGAGASKFTVDHAVSGPLEKAETEDDILHHRWPRPDDFDFSGLISPAQEQRDRIVIGGLWSGILGDAARLYGFQRFLLDIALRPEMIHTLVDTLTDVYLALNDRYFATMKGNLDVFFFGNDFGTQQGLLMGVEMWRDFYFENVRRLCDLAHSYGLTVMMHSCGAVSELIDSLLEAGVDILDPVQTSAVGMAPQTLAERFGGRIVFHGGIDTQHVLPTASPQRAAEHAREMTETFGSAGGYVACGSQLYGPDIPVQNIVAVYRALRALDPAAVMPDALRQSPAGVEPTRPSTEVIAPTEGHT